MAVDLQKEMAELLKNSTAHLVSETSVMHNRPKVKTPLLALNCILGGGIPLGCMVEAYGAPTSGKSSMWYQVMGEFQKTYPEGIGIIVDTEASVDGTRMVYMGCDPQRILRIPATTLEEGFNQVFALLNKKGKNPNLKDLPVFILWDTIGVNPTDKQFQTGEVYGGGMIEKAKLIKTKLSVMLPYIENQPLLVVLLNQVTTEMTKYGSKLSSGGGWAIKHNAHIRFSYASGGTDFEGIYAVRKHSSVNLEKSKLSPLFNNINMIIDITKGGVVDVSRSFLEYCKDKLGLINSGAWSNTAPLAERYPEYVGKFDKFLSNRSFRLSELYDYASKRPKLLRIFELAFIDEICKRYSYQSSICESYRQEVIKSIEEPEPFIDANGNTIDLWTGEILNRVETSDSTTVTSEDFTNIEDTSIDTGSTLEETEDTVEEEPFVEDNTQYVPDVDSEGFNDTTINEEVNNFVQ